MNVGDFITELERRSIHVFLDGEQLGVRAPRGALTAELRAELAARKAALLEVLRRREQPADAPLRITADPAAMHAPFPLSDIQQAYWMGRSGVFELGDTACQSYVEVEGQGMDLDRLEQAWNRLIQRHGMLRAIVRPDGQQQILAEVPRYAFARVDLRGIGAARAAERLEAVREEMSHAVHGTDVWPLFEVRASVLDEGRVRVHLRIELMIADAWSVGILFRDWHRLYQDLDADVGTTEITFRDHVVAEHEARGSEAYQRARDYWRARLAELPMAPELPMARAPSSLGRARFVRRAGHLDQARWQALQDRARRAGLTPSATLCTAFADVLATWSKSPAFTLNLTFFNRPPVHPRIGDVVGDFASTVLLAVDGRGSSFGSSSGPSFEPSFEARAQALQERLGRDLEHSRYSGVSVLRDLNRHHRSAVIMPVVFTSTLSSRASGMFDLGWLGRTVYGVSQTPQVWLDHQITEDASGLVFTWDTVDELFPPGLFDDAFGAYCDLLQDLARGDEPARPAAGAARRHGRAEDAWQVGPGALAPHAHLAQRAQVNATEGPLPDALLHAPFAQQAHGDRPAVIDGDLVLDHRTLDRYARVLAQDLRRAMAPAGAGGPARDALVAVVMDKGWEQVVAVLAVLYAGYAYLPIDPSAPASRLGYLLAQGKVSVALAQPDPAGARAWPDGVAVVHVTREELDRRTGADLAIPSSASPGDLAYVIFTSGSTGKPKGVMIEHRAALNTCLDVNERFSVGPADRVLALSSLTFDLSVYDVFGTLAAGGCIVLPDAARARDPEHWLELVAAHGVTIWNSAPPLMEMLLDAAESRDLRIPDSVRLCLLSGDWIPVSMPERIRRRGPGVRVVSLGGATEAAIWSIAYPIAEVAPEWTSIPYGKPMRNQRFHVLNEHLEPCPIWVPGHLYIGGAGLARGYLGDEALSRARFFVHPRTGERLYRTGDLGRYRPDGNIEFLGRDDFQVKIRGYRVELGEIEAALLEHPAVRQAVVTAVGELRGHKRLAAYVVLDGSGAPGAAELEAFLAARLPDYMVPSWIVPLERLPLGATGKIDRAALPAPASQAAAQVVVPPQGELETRITEIWQKHLHVPAVGVNQNFFDLGGDSVLLLHVMRELRLSIAPDITVIELFRFPTVAALVRHLSERSDTSAAQQARSQERADARKAFIRSRGRGRS